jgi:hypothetical protein
MHHHPHAYVGTLLQREVGELELEEAVEAMEPRGLGRERRNDGELCGRLGGLPVWFLVGSWEEVRL